MKKSIIIFLLFLSILILSCAGPGNQSEVPKNDGTVYLAGFYEVDSKRIPCYWKETERLDLQVPDNCDWGSANSIFIYDNTVYVAGSYYYEKKEITCYWRGTERIDLTVPADCEYSVAQAIFIYDRAVYIAGNYNLKLEYNFVEPKACYWEGTDRTDLEIQANEYSPGARSIFVDDGVIYTAGNYDYFSVETGKIITKPCYWTGSKKTDLQFPENCIVSQAGSILVDNGIVYTGGVHLTTKYNACYWTGTVKTDLPVPAECTNGSFVGSLFIYNGTLYAAGSYGNEGVAHGCYWKGLERTDLPAPDGFGCGASSIFVYNGIVYIAGSYDNHVGVISSTACYWKGTKRIDLLMPQEGSSYSQALAIYVVAEN